MQDVTTALAHAWRSPRAPATWQPGMQIRQACAYFVHFQLPNAVLTFSIAASAVRRTHHFEGVLDDDASLSCDVEGSGRYTTQDTAASRLFSAAGLRRAVQQITTSLASLFEQTEVRAAPAERGGRDANSFEESGATHSLSRSWLESEYLVTKFPVGFPGNGWLQSR